MPTIAAALHERILSTLDAARADLGAVAASATPKQGYIGFDLVDNTLRECRSAIETLRDRDTVVELLRRLDGAVALVGGGDVAPAVERTRSALRHLFEALERGIPGT